MSTYAIGDIQGCYEPLQRLLERIDFDPTRDQLWLTGDLINRGPDSLAVLRWARGLGDAVVAVQGNHDLHFLAVALADAPARQRDRLDELLNARDRRSLIEWQLFRPMMHLDQGFAMVHAGLLPAWTMEQARALGAEVEAGLRGPAPDRLFARMYGNHPDAWNEDLREDDRWRVVINAMTRMRLLTRDARMDLTYSGALESAPAGLVPWFDFPGRASAGRPIVCGHWAALGLRLREDLLALDTGCVWRQKLTAVRLEDRAVFQVDCGHLDPTE